jgi:hypothetical protein
MHNMLSVMLENPSPINVSREAGCVVPHHPDALSTDATRMDLLLQELSENALGNVMPPPPNQMDPPEIPSLNPVLLMLLSQLLRAQPGAYNANF